MAGTDFSHLTSDELIKGIKALDLPDYIRSKAYGIDVRETLAQMTEMTIQLGVNMGLSPDDALKWARKLQESVSQSEFDSWVATLLDGGPSIFMNTLNELQMTYPNGASGVALVRETDPAKIYVWNGSEWADFGDYQGIEVKDNTITTPKIVDESVKLEKIDGSVDKINHFNKEDVYEGQFYTEATIGNEVYLTAYSPTSLWAGSKNKIPVKAGDVVRFNKAYNTGYFVGVDDDNIFRYRAPSVAKGEPATITVPEGVTGFYTTTLKEYLDTLMITVNKEMPSEYVPYGVAQTKNLGWLSISKDNLDTHLISVLDGKNTSDYFGKSMITAGDSITWQDDNLYSGTSNVARGWQTHVKENLGLSIVRNIAISGRSMADGTANGDGTVTTVLSETAFPEDLFVIAAGTNDFKLNVPIGELENVGSTFDRNTFYGAYQTTIEYILSKRADIRIVLFTPLHRNNGAYNSTITVNTAGHKLIDYVEAIKTLGAMYSIPVCDMYANSGINMLTLDVDTIDGLHPNDVGYEKMGNYASKFINKI